MSFFASSPAALQQLCQTSNDRQDSSYDSIMRHDAPPFALVRPAAASATMPSDVPPTAPTEFSSWLEPTPLRPHGAIKLVANVQLQPSPVLCEFATIAASSSSTISDKFAPVPSNVPTSSLSFVTGKRSVDDRSCYDETEMVKMNKNGADLAVEEMEDIPYDNIVDRYLTDRAAQLPTMAASNELQHDNNGGRGEKIPKKDHHCTTKRWSQRFQDLASYQRRHGHCNVSFCNGDDPGLVQWVKRQRYHYNLKPKPENSSTVLTDARIAMLNSIGFVWNAHDANWDDKYQEYCQCDNKEGRKRLNSWMKRQRRMYRRGVMNPYRIQKLESVGFNWGEK